jgi:hypothetical protein
LGENVTRHPLAVMRITIVQAADGMGVRASARELDALLAGARPSGRALGEKSFPRLLIIKRAR